MSTVGVTLCAVYCLFGKVGAWLVSAHPPLARWRARVDCHGSSTRWVLALRPIAKSTRTAQADSAAARKKLVRVTQGQPIRGFWRITYER